MHLVGCFLFQRHLRSRSLAAPAVERATLPSHICAPERDETPALGTGPERSAQTPEYLTAPGSLTWLRSAIWSPRQRLPRPASRYDWPPSRGHEPSAPVAWAGRADQLSPRVLVCRATESPGVSGGFER